MAFPEPTPTLKGKKAAEFEKRLADFKLSSSQKSFYKEGSKLFPRD